MKRPGTWMRPESPQRALIDRIEDRQHRDRIVVNPRAAIVAAEHYASLTGDVDELSFAASILIFLEVERDEHP